MRARDYLVARPLADDVTSNLKRNAGAKPGDKLVLGKPIGVGIISAALKKGKLDVGRATLVEVCDFLAGFLMPPAQAVAGGTTFKHEWPAGGAWKAER